MVTRRRTLDGTRTGRAGTGCYNIIRREELPEELDPVALRLTAASGHRSQVRDLVGRASAGELRRVVIELLSDIDPCLRESRRSSFQLLAAAASISRDAVVDDLP